MFCLCDRVDNMPFEEEQALHFEEETQQVVEEGKCTSSSEYAYSALSQ
jgi:hypothetical protein